MRIETLAAWIIIVSYAIRLALELARQIAKRWPK